MLGVLKAVERFDPERGTPFAAFAVPTVVGELRRHFRDRGWMVRVPRRVQDLHLRIGPVVSELSQQLGRSPTVGEIADAADVRDEDVLEALDAGNRYRPTPRLVPVSMTTSADNRQRARIGRRSGDPPPAAPPALPEREQRVMYMRYFEDMTQAEIAEAIGVSQMHVSTAVDPQPRPAEPRRPPSTLEAVAANAVKNGPADRPVSLTLARALRPCCPTVERWP